MAKPNVKQPVKTVGVFCTKCRSKLYKYRKGGKGSLVKCFIERIVDDYTNGHCACPKCGNEFARSTLIRGVPANKIIGGKVFIK